MPGQRPDFSYIGRHPAGKLARPEVDVPSVRTHRLATALIRVLGDDDKAVGEWDPGLDAETLRAGLRYMMLTRAYDDRMYRQVRAGKTSFYMKCTGEEAIGVAQAMALNPDDMVFPTYRQQGLLIARGYPIVDMMCQCYANKRDPMKGRQLPVLYSSREHSFFSLSGNLGTQFPQAVGWAMASAYKGDRRIAAGWIGEGATAEPDFHHALTFAAVYRAPVVLNVVNNQWAISSHQEVAGGDEGDICGEGGRAGLASAPGRRQRFSRGLRGDAMGGGAGAGQSRRDPDRAVHLSRRLALDQRRPDLPLPRGRSAKDWPLGDPVQRLSRHLINTRRMVRETAGGAGEGIDRGGPRRQPRGREVWDPRPGAAIQCRHDVRGCVQGDAAASPGTARRAEGRIMPSMTMVQALNSAMDVMLARDPNVLVFGEDVGFYGGVFRVTEVVSRKSTANSASSIPRSPRAGSLAVAVGMGAYGLRPVVEIQFADYIYPATDQLVSEAARLRYRSAGEFWAPITVRAPCGGGIFGGQTHSQSPEALFTHVCGLKTVMPSNPYDAKGLLISAIEDDDPVVFFEPKRLYNGPFDGYPDRPSKPWTQHAKSDVPEGHYSIPLGQAAIVREGAAVTILAYGTMVHVALAGAEAAGVDAEVIDLRCLLPLDIDTIAESVKKTGRCVIAHEATRTSGFGAELAALVQEHCFYHLEAPIVRVTGWDTPYPHALEWEYFPGPQRLAEGIRRAMAA